MEFIGKLHPLIVHLPIGLIIAGFGLEVVFRKSNDPLVLKSVKLLIGLAAFSSILSSIFGYLLSISLGYDLSIVSTHKWLGIVFSVVVTLFFFLRSRLYKKRLLWSSWFCVLSLITVTGHFGGSLTHGENYLAESAPSFIKHFFQDEQPRGLTKPMDSIVVFQDMIRPIVEGKCQDCHNSKKSKGRLNLETVAGWKKGGKGGDLIVPNDVFASQILQRIYLPSNDKKHMPPQGKQQLSSAEVALLEWWVEHGGDYNAKLVNLELNPRVDLIIESYVGELGTLPELDLPDYDKADIVEAQNSGLRILPVAKESKMLEVNFRGDSLITEGKLTTMASLYQNIVRIDFGFSGVTNNQLERLAQFEHLNYLSFASTAIDDNGVRHLSGLKNLRELNLHSTQVTKACMPILASMTGLKKVFLWNTKIPEAKLEEFVSNNPSLKIVY